MIISLTLSLMFLLGNVAYVYSCIDLDGFAFVLTNNWTIIFLIHLLVTLFVLGCFNHGRLCWEIGRYWLLLIQVMLHS